MNLDGIRDLGVPDPLVVPLGIVCGLVLLAGAVAVFGAIALGIWSLFNPEPPADD